MHWLTLELFAATPSNPELEQIRRGLLAQLAQKRFDLIATGDQYVANARCSKKNLHRALRGRDCSQRPVAAVKNAGPYQRPECLGRMIVSTSLGLMETQRYHCDSRN